MTGVADYLGNGTLFHAATSGRATFSFIAHLIDRGAKVNERNTSRQNFMHVVRPQQFGPLSNYLELLGLLRQSRFHFDAKDLHGQTMLHVLLRQFGSKLPLDFLSEVLELVQPQLQASDKLGRTLDDYLAHWTGSTEMQITNMRISLSPKKSRIAMLCSKYTHHPLLDQELPKTRFQKFFSFDQAPIEDVDSWLYSMERYRGVTWVDTETGSSAIIALLRQKMPSSRKTIVEAINGLLDKGAEINHQDRKGLTALSHACCLGLRYVAEVLLERDANPNMRAYDTTSLLDHVTFSILQAHRHKDLGLRGRITSCVHPLLEAGAFADPTYLDTWKVREVVRLNKKMVLANIKAKQKAEARDGMTTSKTTTDKELINARTTSNGTTHKKEILESCSPTDESGIFTDLGWTDTLPSNCSPNDTSPDKTSPNRATPYNVSPKKTTPSGRWLSKRFEVMLNRSLYPS